MVWGDLLALTQSGDCDGWEWFLPRIQAYNLMDVKNFH